MEQLSPRPQQIAHKDTWHEGQEAQTCVGSERSAMDPLSGSLPTKSELLTHFISRDLSEPTGDADAAEIGKLLAATKRPANATFLSALLPTKPISHSDADELDAVRARTATSYLSRIKSHILSPHHRPSSALSSSPPPATARSRRSRRISRGGAAGRRRATTLPRRSGSPSPPSARASRPSSAWRPRG